MWAGSTSTGTATHATKTRQSVFWVVIMRCAVFVLMVAALFQDVIAQYNSYRNQGADSTYVAQPSDTEGLDILPNETPAKVRLDVYYETDCPDSMHFITDQLYPLYQEMGEVLDIHLVPYGKARNSYNNVSEKYDFMCQHGASECFGNAVQSCVKSLYPEEKDYLNFINCMEAYPRPSQNGHKCARRMSLDWSKIEKCSRGEEGNRLQKLEADLTENLNPRLYFVPWVVVDNKWSRSNQRLVLRNLKMVVCSAYQGAHPKCDL